MTLSVVTQFSSMASHRPGCQRKLNGLLIFSLAYTALPLRDMSVRECQNVLLDALAYSVFGRSSLSDE